MRLFAHPRPPLTRGLDFAQQKTGGENISLLVFLSLRQKSKIFATSLVRGRLAATAGLGIAKAFLNHQPCWWFSLTNKGTAAQIAAVPFILFAAGSREYRGLIFPGRRCRLPFRPAGGRRRSGRYRSLPEDRCPASFPRIPSTRRHRWDPCSPCRTHPGTCGNSS